MPKPSKKRGRRDDWDLFFDRHKPFLNHLETHAPFNDAMFETFGKELNYVKQWPNKHIFTLVEGDNGNSYACPGYHYVNRMGYFIVKVPWTSESEQRCYKL